jgi:hypothetical protein
MRCAIKTLAKRREGKVDGLKGREERGKHKIAMKGKFGGYFRRGRESKT